MNPDEAMRRLKMRVSILEAELAAAAGMAQALAEQYERQDGLDSQLARHFHERAASFRRLARVQIKMDS